MLPRSVVFSAIALGVLSLALPGQAQQRRNTGGAQTAQTPDVLPPASESGGANGPPADAPAPEKKPVTPAAGYAYGDKPMKPTASSGAPHTRYRSRGPVVNMPGFEQTADGGSRLFVQLSQTVPVEERKAQGTITYVLKGASPRVWNNTNALVTVHFNTPVARARLVPHGQDLQFIVELRSAATPTWKMNESPDKSATLAIDFPKGDYLQAGGTEAPTADASAPRPAPKTRGGKRAPVKTAPAPAAPPADGPKP